MLKNFSTTASHIARQHMRASAACIRNIAYLQQQSRNISSKGTKTSSVYEPDYLDLLKPKYPQYESLNVQLKGYDYPILESYQRYLHSAADYLDMDVSDCYALPPQKTTVTRLRPNTTVVESEYQLTMYERNLQLNNVDVPVYPIFLRIAQAALPEGVQLNVIEHTEEVEERRYVPDKDLMELKAQLEGMQGGNMPAKKK